jgi:hypothetical protein
VIPLPLPQLQSVQNLTGYNIEKMIARQRSEWGQFSAAEPLEFLYDSGILADCDALIENLDGKLLLFGKQIDTPKMQIVITVAWV